MRAMRREMTRILALRKKVEIYNTKAAPFMPWEGINKKFSATLKHADRNVVNAI